jgi:acyl transferase domain-containing protein/acyl carrier protein
MKDSLEGIAVIGLSGRFPGAKSVDEFWQNLRNGVESITHFSDQELEASGIDLSTLSNPNYVKAKGALEDIELFDAAFFGFTPREAEIMDPQHRIFLECAWECLEHAGYNPEAYQGLIGVYAGVSVNTYWMYNLHSNRDLLATVGEFQTLIENDKDYLTTRVSYKMNLKGPSVAIQTACSTSLVAVHLACQSLLSYQCDIALAGGASVGVPQKAGYLYQEGGILSPDGHCRAFDASAQGIVGGNGVGVVALKRLQDAIADGDCIYSVITGSAINNDGSLKVGYTAPSVDGQTEVIAMAQAIAGIEPETVTYIETHGTGTPLGDPIEIAALTQVFRASTDKKGFCAIGSVKTNIGHLDAAAGVAGLIKTILAIQHKSLPPSLHFQNPNPKIDFANSPFYVNTTLAEWKANQTRRRAGVSSFGIGGTNAHVVVEEGPIREASGDSRPWHLLTLSAKTSPALDVARANLVEHLKQHPEQKLADVAFTLQVGRKAFDQRLMLIARDSGDAVSTLEPQHPERVLTGSPSAGHQPIVFMFPGQGSQYINMGLELYQVEPTFREQVDFCSEFLKPYLGLNLRKVLYPAEGQVEKATRELNQTVITQPALFVVEYAVAKLLMKWGVQPQAMIGHSIGEYVAACLAGVFSLEEALKLVAARGRLMGEMLGGSMLAVPLPEKEVRLLLNENLSLAAVNGPANCVVSGPAGVVDELESQLNEKGVTCRRLRTSHAFHSNMVEPIIGRFIEQFKGVNLNPPEVPYLSNVTGTWATAWEATDASYWGRHLRQTVRFAEGVDELLKESNGVLLEVGPGQSLSALVRRHPERSAEGVVLTCLRSANDQSSDVEHLLNTLGRLWLAGAPVDWPGFYAQERRHRVPLPTYPFERQWYWVEPQNEPNNGNAGRSSSQAKSDIANWFYVPSWKRSVLPKASRLADPENAKSSWLVFVDGCGLGHKIVERLLKEGRNVAAVMVGEQFSEVDDNTFTIRPGRAEDYDILLAELRSLGKVPQNIIHLWSVTPNHNATEANNADDEFQDIGFYSLLYLAQSLGNQNITDPLQIEIVSNNMHDVMGEELLYPEKATVLGPCKVIPQEFPNIACLSVDIVLPESEARREETVVDSLIAELATKPSDAVVAYRGSHRWVQTYQPLSLGDDRGGYPLRLREKGVYLITGGLGSMGLAFAKYLAEKAQARLVLIGRSGLPPREEWPQWRPEEDGWVSELDRDEERRMQLRVGKVQQLEELGSEVLVIKADVTDREQMRSVVSQCYDRFGEIHGVIHTAGILGQGIIQLKTPEEADRVLAPKVKGTLVLDAVLKDVKLDFMMLCSSLSSVSPLIGQIDYSAANAFLDAFAHYRANQIHDCFTVSVDWGFWQELGMAANAAVHQELKQRIEEGLRNGPLSNAGVEVFSRILSGGSEPQVLVSPVDIQVAMDRMNSATPSVIPQETREERSSRPAHTRPHLGNPFVAPRDEVEGTVADFWQQLLGIDQVGIYDDFFELGGDSLLGVQLISRVKRMAQIELTLRDFFEAPTVAQLSNLIKNTQSSQGERQETTIVPLAREAYRMNRSSLNQAG